MRSSHMHRVMIWFWPCSSNTKLRNHVDVLVYSKFIIHTLILKMWNWGLQRLNLISFLLVCSRKVFTGKMLTIYFQAQSCIINYSTNNAFIYAHWSACMQFGGELVYMHVLNLFNYIHVCATSSTQFNHAGLY